MLYHGVRRTGAGCLYRLGPGAAGPGDRRALPPARRLLDLRARGAVRTRGRRRLRHVSVWLHAGGRWRRHQPVLRGGRHEHRDGDRQHHTTPRLARSARYSGVACAKRHRQLAEPGGTLHRRMSQCTCPSFIAAVLVFSSQLGSAQDLSRYRAYVLESSLESVVAASGARAADVKTLHERPAKIQELEWRAPYASSGSELADPVRGAVFTFCDDALYQVVVSYDRDRTNGLTNSDSHRVSDGRLRRTGAQVGEKPTTGRAPRHRRAGAMG